MIEIREIQKQDYKKAQKFAIQGMHLNWYMDNETILSLYSKYFWYMELNRATKAYGAYVNDCFVGVLLADMNGEKKRYHSFWRTIFVKALAHMTQRIRRCLRLSAKSGNPMGKSFFLLPTRNVKSRGLAQPCFPQLKRKNRGNWFISTPTMPAPISFMNTEDLRNQKQKM